MGIEPATVALLNSILSSSSARRLFKMIATSRIAEKAALKEADPEADRQLGALKSADLIDAGPNGEKYFVTAKGLKVARDLEQLPLP